MDETTETVPEDITVESEPISTTAIFFIVAGIVIAGVSLYQFLGLGKAKEVKKGKDVDVDDVTTTNTVGLKDIKYIANKLHPASSHMDVLMAVISTPENVAYGLKAYNAKEKVRRKRIEDDLEESKSEESKKVETKSDSKDMFNFDDDGWADDDDDDEKAKAAAKAEEQKKKDREQLNKAVGKTKIKLEGIDEGVIGQKWVEKVLTSKGVWPPKNLGVLEGQTFEYEGKQVSALDHPGLRRNLCMLTGRINSILLNSHPELLEAGSKQNIDQTYFKGSMEFRGRCAMLLEASLRTAVACRNFPLAKTIVETVSMFKIGTDSHKKIEWFDKLMQKQYQTLPRLEITNTSVVCPDESDMATGDILNINLELSRLHAEAFTRQKIAMFQKQGIPPQVALQTYREGWWFLVHAERLDGETPGSALELKTDGLLKEVAADDIAKFQKATFKDRILTAWPMVVQNVAQKSGKIKIQFLAPPVPGKYKFTVSVMSQDFLGADQEFSAEGTILSASSVVRKPKESKPQVTVAPEDQQVKKDK